MWLVVCVTDNALKAAQHVWLKAVYPVRDQVHPDTADWMRLALHYLFELLLNQRCLHCGSSVDWWKLLLIKKKELLLLILLIDLWLHALLPKLHLPLILCSANRLLLLLLSSTGFVKVRSKKTSSYCDLECPGLWMSLLMNGQLTRDCVIQKYCM